MGRMFPDVARAGNPGRRSLLMIEFPVQIINRVDDHARSNGDEQNVLCHPYEPVP